MAKGAFPAKAGTEGDSLPDDWELAPSGAWFCPKCGFVKLNRCTYRGHRSFSIGTPDGHRHYVRTVKALQRTAKERLCKNPECASPFLPLHARQVYCCDRCRDRAKYLRRRLGH